MLAWHLTGQVALSDQAGKVYEQIGKRGTGLPWFTTYPILCWVLESPVPVYGMDHTARINLFEGDDYFRWRSDSEGPAAAERDRLLDCEKHLFVRHAGIELDDTL